MLPEQAFDGAWLEGSYEQESFHEKVVCPLLKKVHSYCISFWNSETALQN
jgi:hypothetical protein